MAVLPKASKLRHNYVGTSKDKYGNTYYNRQPKPSLNVPVSNSNVRGYKNIDTLRKGLLKLKAKIANNDFKSTTNTDYRKSIKDLYSGYLDEFNNIVEGDTVTLNADSQYQINSEIKDINTALKE